MNLVPPPKEITPLPGKTTIPGGRVCMFISNKELFNFALTLKSHIPSLVISFYDDRRSFIRVVIDEAQVGRRQGYRLEINGRVRIIANDLEGARNGLVTLRQILRLSKNHLDNVRIFDWPDFHSRGFMLDISRNKVPKVKTIFELIDILAELKYNQLQLYTEHTFAYRDHEVVWRDYSPLTSEDVVEIDRYARSRGIELVPNQNSFGHMSKWLIHDEYKHLAEAPEGFVTPWGERWNFPFSLSPVVPEVYDFLKSLYDELLPNFSSDKFNVGCDETFDLCQGRSKKLCEEIGKGRVYLRHLLKVHEMVKDHGKTMMFWGDIIKEYPDLVGELPDGMIALVWGYEATHPFEEECGVFRESGIPFYVCPGTSSWNAVVGRVDNMLKNVDRAVAAGRDLGAVGVLMTDWGDNGHWQHFPFSLPGIVHAGVRAWSSEAEYDLAGALSDHVLLDPTGRAARAILDLGNAYLESGVDIPNANIFGAALIWPDKVKDIEVDLERLKRVKEKLFEALDKMNGALVYREDGDLILREMKNGADMAMLAVDLVMKMKGTDVDISGKLDRIIEEFVDIWLARNRSGGLRKSVERLERVRGHL